MNNLPSTSKCKQNDDFEDDDMFEDSTLWNEFNNSSKQISKSSENNINTSLNKSALNVSALCCDEEISGYDKLTGKTWIYPTNYPVRDYQFNIIKASILKNTLVSLPTGLGKTFIAAVIMYNFYRWYPLGKIVFTAPTRPLVKQQIEACYNIIAIPPSDSVEMTGHMQVNLRKEHWQKKRVFFATPQVIYNDMKSGICPCDQIRCLVFDEAHKAQRNYAYCQIISTLDDSGHKTYRVLALSATPGSKVEDVTRVVKNLHIAHLELRTEESIDIAKYSHSRNINKVVIPLDTQLTQLRQQYIEILDGYARRLKQMNILPPNLGNLSKGRIVMLYKEYQNKDRSARHPQHNYIMKDFVTLIGLYHGLELLSQQGSRVFLNFFDDHPEKSWIQSDDNLTSLLERLRDDLGVNPLSLDRSILPDGTVPQLPKDLCFGHPKFLKLKEIMTNHFTKAKHNKQETKAIVFCEYRESVNLVHCLLLQCRPLIKPQMFVGQGASGKDGRAVVSQKQQARVMASFRAGESNALVATCVAEEGLDVGSVDLIVCFDISTKSPVRLVQRCGRTGRERGGQVYILVTEGKEHQTLNECMRQRDGLNKKILQSEDIRSNLYTLNPRMMPRDFMPECQKMFITVAKKQDPKEKGKETLEKSKKNQKDLRSMLLKQAPARNSTSKDSTIRADSSLITEAEFNQLYPNGYSEEQLFPTQKEYWAMNKEAIKNVHNSESHEINLSKWLEWQRRLHKTVNIHRSKDSEILTDLLQFSDAKRFEMPASTQNPSFPSQELPSQRIVFHSPLKSPLNSKQPKKKQKAPVSKKESESPKKYGDIRALFSAATKSTTSYTKSINDLGLQNSGSLPTRLISLLVDLSLDNTKPDRVCHVCQNIGDCTDIQHIRAQKKTPNSIKQSLSNINLPQIDLIDYFDTETVLKCSKKSNENVATVTNNFDLEADFLSDNEPEQPIEQSNKQNSTAVSDNFEIGDIGDIFADSSPEEAIQKESTAQEETPEETPKETNDALGFFGLDSIDDIFADDVIDNTPPELTAIPTKSNNNTQITKSQKAPNVYPTSPSILSGRQRAKELSTSPILCSQPRKLPLSTKKNRSIAQNLSPLNCRKQLIKESTSNNNIIEPAAKQKSLMKDSLVDTSNKSLMTITQLVDMINTTDGNTTLKKSNLSESKLKERSVSPILLTQSERKKSLYNNTNNAVASTSRSLTILDSDSDSNGTEIYDPTEHFDNAGFINISTNSDKSPVTNKRKLGNDTSDTVTASPYFNKKPKLENLSDKEMTLQEKVLAAISSNKFNKKDNDKTVLNFVVSQPSLLSQKENRNPNFNDANEDDDYKNNKLSALQMFRRDKKLKIDKSKFDTIFKKSPVKAEMSQKRKLTFEDSDDDFVFDEKSIHVSQRTACDNMNRSTTYHKARKKKRKKTAHEFLDMEAELSDEDAHSGDELSDESVGSIIDFICDENVTHHEDIQAVYLKSIKSPIRGGGFKIPELPSKFRKEDVLSQYVEDDTYEMDSFCVDSHIGFTQVNEVSELELAELVLEEERKTKKKSRRICSQDESPVAVKRKPKRRLIDSDSDDSG